MLGRNVARIRAGQGLSQTALAGKLGPKNLGVTQGYISELESGSKNPTLLTMVALAEALGVSLLDLLDGSIQSRYGSHLPND